MPSTASQLAAVVAALGLLTGCGQTGPLVHPQSAPKSAPTSAAPAAADERPDPATPTEAPPVP